MRGTCASIFSGTLREHVSTDFLGTTAMLRHRLTTQKVMIYKAKPAMICDDNLTQIASTLESLILDEFQFHLVLVARISIYSSHLFSIAGCRVCHSSPGPLGYQTTFRVGRKLHRGLWGVVSGPTIQWSS